MATIKKKWAVLDNKGYHLIDKGTDTIAVWDDEKAAKADVIAAMGGKRMPNGYKAVRLTDEELAELMKPLITMTFEPEDEESEPAFPDTPMPTDELVPMEGEIVPADVDLTAAELDSMELPELAAKANQWTQNSETAIDSANTIYQVGVQWAVRAGMALRAAKALVPHGEFGGWLDANYDRSERTAQVYMGLAEDPHSSAVLNAPSIVAAIEARAEEKAAATGATRKKKDKKPKKPQLSKAEWMFGCNSKGQKLIAIGDQQLWLADAIRAGVLDADDTASYLHAELERAQAVLEEAFPFLRDGEQSA